MNEKTRYPLCWPADWKRTASRSNAQFGKVNSNANGYAGKSRLSITDAVDRIADELRRIGIKEETVIISTNIQLNLNGVPRGDRGEPADPGVAVYWTRKGKPQCMPIDRYTRVADNLAAVAATLEALRAVERHGGRSIIDRAFMGFAQLPQSIVTPRPWRQVLGFEENEHVDDEYLTTRFRLLAAMHHPDTGGDHDSMVELNAARDAALRELHG